MAINPSSSGQNGPSVSGHYRASLTLQDGNQLNEFLDHPLMELNEEYILFLEKSSDGHLIMMGGPNGKLTYNSVSDKYESLTGVIIDESLGLY